MSFAAFSKDFTANMFTSVENRFLTNYLPQADGDAVRVYLYGLYLCSCKEEVDGPATAKLLRLSYERLLEIFDFWEECDLLHVLSREPLMVEYLPVSSAVGRPKPLRPEKYAQFNRELLRLLSRAGKDFKPYEQQRILEFLENNPMEPQALLLIVEYCIKKDGNRVSAAHILNKAKQLCAEHKFTFEQAEEEFAGYNKHEKTVSALFERLGVYRKPQESDYALLDKWLAMGMEEGALLEAAATLKKGSPASLDVLVGELAEKKACTASAAKAYLARRETLASAVFAVGRKLGVKVQDPRAFIETYAEKWFAEGFDTEGLTLLGGLCFKLGLGFGEMDSLLDELAANDTKSLERVQEFCTEQDKRLRLLQRVCSVCGAKKTPAALKLVGSWWEKGLSDALILEAARRSAGTRLPLSYMNKLLLEWQQSGLKTVSELPDAPARTEYKNEAVVAADKRAEREHYYAVLRQRAERSAAAAKRRAEGDAAFREADSAVKREEIALARAEVFSPKEADDIRTALEEHRAARTRALTALGLSEQDLEPKFTCPKCSDTGFLPDGRPCDCFKG